MKKYIRSASSEELRRKLDKKLEEESIDDLVRPVIKRIADAFVDETGFEIYVMKYYYREDLNAVLLNIGYDNGTGYPTLMRYTNPGRAKPSHPAMISLDASDNEIYEYVDRLVDALVEDIQSHFDTWAAISSFDGEDESMLDSEYQIAKLVKYAPGDKTHQANFIRSLLNSGEVVNKLWDYVAEDDKGYYLVDKKGNKVDFGTLYYKRKNM